MKVEIEVPNYDPFKGVSRNWDIRNILTSEWHEEHGEFVIEANSEALRELAIHLLTLAQKEVPAGSHLHYDPWNDTTQPGSVPFVIIKI